jgi:periplasmic protein TonB
MKLSSLIVSLLLISPTAAISQVGSKDKSASKSTTEKPVQFQVIEVENSPEGEPDYPSIALPVEAVEEAPSDPVFSFVEKMPEFKGGSEALKKFISNHLVYPLEAIEKGIQGTVYIKFIVRMDGTLTDFEVIRTLHPSTSKAALDVVKLTQGDWTPGEHKGKKVDVYNTVAVKFSLKD